MRIRALLPFLVAYAVAAACVPAPAPYAAPAGSGAPEPLVSSLHVEPDADAVRMVLQVTNAGAGPVTLTFPSGQSYDFAVHAGGETVWHWSADRSFIQAVRQVRLAEGETLTFSETWTPTGTLPAELTATAWLTSSSHPVEQSAPFRLP